MKTHLQSVNQPETTDMETQTLEFTDNEVHPQSVSQPRYKLIDLQMNLSSIFSTLKIFFEQSFKSLSLKIINSMIKIKQTETRISKLKQQSTISDKTKDDISQIENDIDDIKIQLIDNIKASVKLVREVNKIYNRWLAEVVDLMILPLDKIEESTDLPLKLLQQHYIEGLPYLLIKSNILSPYLKKSQNEHKPSTEISEEKLENPQNNLKNQTLPRKLSIENTVSVQSC